uniref:Collagenase 3 n=1 Tax=Salarias fasciatus TaxID=181472 RepID=A0A672IWB2_SALFA
MELLRMTVLGSVMLLSWSLPVAEERRPRPEDVELAEDYLRRFYSLKLRGRNQREIRSAPATEDKIREMQNFFGLKETGLLDSDTLKVMKKPRCGVPDVDNFSFYPTRPKWKKNTITYMISRFTPDMKKEDVEKSFRLALKMWSDATPLKFIKVNQGPADIVFTFARGMHGDFFPFDGPGGVLAHAFQPGEGIGGDVHFDDDETWTAAKQGYNLFAVAAHELGHSLGLTHSQDPSSIMYPTYRHHSSTQYSLSADDEQGIQTLYGEYSEIKPSSEKCSPNFSFDAAAIIEKEIVFFRNKRMWRRTTKSTYWNRLRDGMISTYFPSIGAHVDAAYDIPAKGRKYWVVQQLKAKSRGGSIHEYGLPSSVRQVDAAVHVSEYGKTMFFVGEFYYRYDEQKKEMDPGFPRVIERDWLGIPRTVDAAFKLHGSIFLLSGAHSYQYDFRQKRVVKVISGNNWLGC